MKQFAATRAFIVSPKGKVLIIREAQEYEGGYQTGKYDLPGGKIEPGESAVDATKREVGEEAGLEVEVGQPIFVSEWYPVIGGEKRQIVGVFFVCRPTTTAVTLSDDHDDYQWIDPREYGRYALMEENIGVFQAYINQ